MKNFSNPTRENPSDFPEAKSHPMLPQIGRGSFENVRFAGTNVGASMVAGGGSGESAGSCTINIYINNDIQGINNSALIGSEMKMGDPGVSLVLENLKMDRGLQKATKKEDMGSVTRLMLLLAFVTLVISVFAYLLV